MAGRYVSEIEIKTNVEKALKQILELQKKTDDLENKEYKIDIGVDSQKLEKVIGSLEKMLDSLGKGTGDFKQFENLSKELTGITSDIQSLSKAFGKVDDSGTKTLLSSIQSIDKSLSDLSQHIIGVNADFGSIGKNASDNVGQINEAKKATKGLTDATKDLAKAQQNLNGNKSNISSGNPTIKDVFQNDSDSSSIAKEEASVMEQVESATEQAVQAKKDFATANEGVQDSVADSKSPLQLEAELMQQIAKDARDAADAKKEFVEANKQVKDSVDDSNGSEKKKGSKNENQKTVNKALTEQITAWKKIQSIREQIEKTKDSNNKSELENIQKYYQEQYDSAKSILSANEDLYNTEKQISRIKQIELETDAKISKYRASQKASTVSSFQSSIDSYQSKLTKYSNRPTEKQSVEYQNLLTEYQSQLEQLKKRFGELSEEKIISEDQINSFNKLKEQLDTTDLKFQNVFKGDDLISVKKEIDTITQYMSKNTRISSEAKDKLRGYIEELKTKGADANVKAIHAAFLDICDGERKAKREGQSFLDVLRDKVWYQWAAQIGSYFSLNDIMNYGKQAASIVTELNTQITDLAKVSEATSKQIYADFDSYADIAKDIGGTISDTISATADWSRNGYSIPDSKELAEVALLYKNVGDGIDIDEANESLISTLRGFKMEAEEAIDIIDIFNEVSNNEPISSSGIGEALQRSAASFNAANTSLQESVALISATRLHRLVEYMETCIRNIFNCHRSLYYHSLQYRGNYYMNV